MKGHTVVMLDFVAVSPERGVVFSESPDVFCGACCSFFMLVLCFRNVATEAHAESPVDVAITAEKFDPADEDLLPIALRVELA